MIFISEAHRDDCVLKGYGERAASVFYDLQDFVVRDCDSLVSLSCFDQRAMGVVRRHLTQRPSLADEVLGGGPFQLGGLH